MYNLNISNYIYNLNISSAESNKKRSMYYKSNGIEIMIAYCF